jgi:hypothetical protein
LTAAILVLTWACCRLAWALSRADVEVSRVACETACLGGLCLLEFQFVGFGFDREQRGACFHHGAVFIVDRLQDALHPGDEIDRLHRSGIAGGFEIARDVALHRQRNVHLRRRWRHKTILFAGG